MAARTSFFFTFHLLGSGRRSKNFARIPKNGNHPYVGSAPRFICRRHSAPEFDLDLQPSYFGWSLPSCERREQMADFRHPLLRESRRDRMRKMDLPSRLMPTAMHFLRRQYWQRFLFIRRMEHCWFLVHGLYWIFCWMLRLKKPCNTQKRTC
jgi:hypothetical protein